MRVFILVLVVAVFQYASVQAADDSKAGQPSESAVADQWHLLCKGSLAEIHVSRTLYEKEGDGSFFIRIRLTNTTDHPIGADLRSFWKIIYPNQVGFLSKRQRDEVDERKMDHKPLSDEEKAKLVADFKAGSLVSIPAHGSTGYFRKFNSGEGLAYAKKEDGKFFFISLGGEQLLTDGTSVEQVSCEWERSSVKGRAGVDTELFIPTPIKWERIPADGRIVSDK